MYFCTEGVELLQGGFEVQQFLLNVLVVFLRNLRALLMEVSLVLSETSTTQGVGRVHRIEWVHLLVSGTLYVFHLVLSQFATVEL